MEVAEAMVETEGNCIEEFPTRSIVDGLVLDVQVDEWLLVINLWLQKAVREQGCSHHMEDQLHIMHAVGDALPAFCVWDLN